MSENRVVAVVGHSGHGKSTLVSHIACRMGAHPTAVADGSRRLSYRTQNRGYTLVDCSGSFEHMKSQLASVGTPSDAVLVVSATDGVLPGTRDGIKLARQLGAGRILVFLSRAEEVTDEEIFDLVEMEIRDQLATHEYPESSTFVRSAAPQTEQSDGMTAEKAAMALVASLELGTS